MVALQEPRHLLEREEGRSLRAVTYTIEFSPDLNSPFHALHQARDALQVW